MPSRLLWTVASLTLFFGLLFTFAWADRRSELAVRDEARGMGQRDIAGPHDRVARRQLPRSHPRSRLDTQETSVNEDASGPPDIEGMTNDELAELTAEELKAHALGDRLEKRGEEVRRQEIGRRRFSRGVAESGVSAEQMDHAVIGFFETIELQPLLDAEGMLQGFELADLEIDSPLRDAGFRRGDLITRIDEQLLHDPADLPDLLVAIGRDIHLCGRRASEEICATVHLD